MMLLAILAVLAVVCFAFFAGRWIGRRENDLDDFDRGREI